MSDSKILDAIAIRKYLPHRYPFLLVDRVLDYNESYVKALKNVTLNEEFFMGHFPEQPVMPGVLQIEAMAQAAVFLSYEELIKQEKALEVYFMGIESAKFRKMVVPGDQLIIEINLIKKKREFWWMSGSISVDGNVVCEANMSAVLKLR